MINDQYFWCWNMLKPPEVEVGMLVVYPILEAKWHIVACDISHYNPLYPILVHDILMIINDISIFWPHKIPADLWLRFLDLPAPGRPERSRARREGSSVGGWMWNFNGFYQWIGGNTGNHGFYNQIQGLPGLIFPSSNAMILNVS